MWLQKKIQLDPRPRGFHLITSEILQGFHELQQINVGWLQVFIQHTSASLSINENADPDVRLDMETAVNRMVPENWPFVHTCEGPDDMPAHVKAAMFGSSVMVPVTNGALALGIWQGIYLCEHRDHGGSRNLILTLNGEGEREIID